MVDLSTQCNKKHISQPHFHATMHPTSILSSWATTTLLLGVLLFFFFFPGFVLGARKGSLLVWLFCLDVDDSMMIDLYERFLFDCERFLALNKEVLLRLETGVFLRGILICQLDNATRMFECEEGDSYPVFLVLCSCCHQRQDWSDSLSWPVISSDYVFWCHKFPKKENIGIPIKSSNFYKYTVIYRNVL